MNLDVSPHPVKYISRGGDKLAAALDAFQLNIENAICADLGSHIGGFVECLLRRGAARVYSVDTCYGTLAWKLRKDARVVVLERTNAMHVDLPERVDVVTLDVGWTPQAKVLPNVRRLVRESGHVVALLKPHYEAPRELVVDGVLPDDSSAAMLECVTTQARACGFEVRQTIASPIRGHGGNRELFLHLIPVVGQGLTPWSPR